jgi:hypothetical protein
MIVAMSIAGVVFALAWPWCWQVAGVAVFGQRASEASSSLAYARRTFGADARRAVRLVAPPEARCSAADVTLDVVTAAPGARERVRYAFDSQRGVLWRKAPSTYLVERVVRCRFTFFGADGREIAAGPGGELAPDEVARVSRVRLELDVRVGGDGVRDATCDVCLRVPQGS